MVKIPARKSRQTAASRGAFRLKEAIVHVELGNPNPRSDASSPAVMTVSVPDSEGYTSAEPGFAQEVDGSGELREMTTAAELATEVMRQVASGGGLTHLPGQEAVLSVVACWNAEGSGKPSWVEVEDNPDFEKLLSEFFGCPRGKPADVEQTHYTVSGPPGVGPRAAAEEVV